MKIEIAPKEYERTLNWDDAMMYCQLLVIDNKNDWRLPTKDELNYIYSSKNDFVGSYYWSSTEGIGDYAWMQGFSIGGRDFSPKNNSFYVRAVRSVS